MVSRTFFGALSPPDADWLIVNTWLPTVIVAVLAVVEPVFFATVKFTVEAPVPLGDVTVTHVALDTAVQPHVVPQVIDTPPVPPAWLKLCDDAPSAYWQGAAASTTVNDCPPIVSVAERLTLSVLGAAVKVTVPDPLPVGVPMVTHDAPLVAVQLHPASEVSETEPAPPP
jgi:hypothetical protein